MSESEIKLHSFGKKLPQYNSTVVWTTEELSVSGKFCVCIFVVSTKGRPLSYTQKWMNVVVGWGIEFSYTTVHCSLFPWDCLGEISTHKLPYSTYLLLFNTQTTPFYLSTSLQVAHNGWLFQVPLSLSYIRVAGYALLYPRAVHHVTASLSKALHQGITLFTCSHDSSQDIYEHSHEIHHNTTPDHT